MKIEIREMKGFEPREITISIENRDDLYALVDMMAEKRIFDIDSPDWKAIMETLKPFYNAIRKYIDDIGDYKNQEEGEEKIEPLL